MALPNWLKNALIQSDDTTTQEVVQQPVSKPNPTSTPNPIKNKIKVTPVPVPTTNYVATEEDSAELDESYINHLSDFMEKCNLPGPDYLEFARSLDEMNTEMGESAPEDKIFQMTYKVGYKQNLPVPKLVETAQTYIGLFGQHFQEFEKFLNEETKQKVGSKIDENNRLTTQIGENIKKIEQLKQQIETLEQTIEQNNQTIEQNNTTIQTETNKLNLKKAKFTKAYNFVVGKITDDIEKIKKYLSNIK